MSPAAPLHARPLRLSTQEAGFEAAFAQRLHWSAEEDAAVESRVRAILLDVRARGDAALLQYTRALDRVEAHSVQALQIAPEEMQAAFEALSHKQKSALQAAAQRVRCYHEAQKNACCQGWSYREADGSVLGQTVTPLESVGVYVPGGKAAYPSSVLMNAIPARVAGVAEIIMAVPTPGGEKNRMVLAAAHLAGVTRGFCMGGAQAVAALAFGTESVPKVDKITGPGNAYVASAKKQVFGQVGIDMIAGPSEILILADGSVPPDWVAMDLFAQAEHDELAQSILLCPDAAYLDAVQQAMERLLPEMPRQAIISKSLNARGALIHTRDLAEACGIANRIAPEHLEIACAEPEQWQPHLRHAGAIFVGAYASESLGDYCAGPNHVLPTSGTARFSSPLGVYDFQKRSSVLHISQQAAQTLGPVAATLALEEGLQAHAHAARMRTSDYTPFTQGAARVRHNLDAVLARLASLRDEWSGTPPDEALLDAHENTLGLKLHADVRHFFKTLGEVSFGALDNLSAQRKWREEDAHCQLITTNLEARQMGVPPSWLVLVEDNSNYFCVKPDGRVSYWAHDSEMEEEEWENLATWIDEVWIEEGLAGENDEE